MSAWTEWKGNSDFSNCVFKKVLTRLTTDFNKQKNPIYLMYWLHFFWIVDVTCYHMQKNLFYKYISGLLALSPFLPSHSQSPLKGVFLLHVKCKKNVGLMDIICAYQPHVSIF